MATARRAASLGRHDEAERLARAAVALAPSSARALAALGTAQLALGRPAEARVALEAALAFDDDDLPAMLACATAQAADGAPGAARALLTHLLLRTRSAALRAEAEALLAELPMFAGDARDDEGGAA